MAAPDLVGLSDLMGDAKCFALVRQHRWPAEGEVRLPKPERRRRDLRALVRRRRKPVILFVDEAHNLHPKTLTGLKRIMAVVADGGGRLSVVLARLAAGPVVPAAAHTRAAGQAAAERLLAHGTARDGRLTAVAAANDLLALGAYRALAARGLACPGDVSVTGHNDMPLVDMVQPPLTTVRILHDRIGREGARLLLERIERPDAPPVQVRTAPELVVRASTAPPG